VLNKLKGNLKCNTNKQFGMPEIVRNRPEGIHTVEDMSRYCVKRYKKNNIVITVIEENIKELCNTKRNIKSYHVEIQRNGKLFSKYYPLLDQARIFKKTIINHFNKLANENS